MADPLPFRRAAIIGTGLIGGSFALALRKYFARISVVGYDRPETLARAREMGTVEETASNISEAVRGADLVYVALPIAATLHAFPAIAGAVDAGALITDACSTKTVICANAEITFQGGARFLGGHPMAGKERSGIENADSELFRGAPYALIGTEETPDSGSRVSSFVSLLRAMGANPVWCDAETHDWAVGIVSHLPQLVSVALAGVVQDETDETGLPLSLAGTGLHDTLRLAGSPYAVWRDILLTNKDNVARALERLAQAVEHLRTQLRSKELEKEFQTANELHKLLRKNP
jgi:prephenate dehydrogenase